MAQEAGHDMYSFFCFSEWKREGKPPPTFSLCFLFLFVVWKLTCRLGLVRPRSMHLVTRTGTDVGLSRRDKNLDQSIRVSMGNEIKKKDTCCYLSPFSLSPLFLFLHCAKELNKISDVRESEFIQRENKKKKEPICFFGSPVQFPKNNNNSRQGNSPREISLTSPSKQMGGKGSWRSTWTKHICPSRILILSSSSYCISKASLFFSFMQGKCCAFGLQLGNYFGQSNNFAPNTKTSTKMVQGHLHSLFVLCVQMAMACTLAGVGEM